MKYELIKGTRLGTAVILTLIFIGLRLFDLPGMTWPLAFLPMMVWVIVVAVILWLGWLRDTMEENHLNKWSK